MIKVLIADDEELERRILRVQLENEIENVAVVGEAKNGVELVEMALTLKPEIIIVDINMPGISGVDAIKILRDKGSDAKVIIHSAYGEFDFAQSAIEARVDEYILKPVKKERFICAVQKCVNEIMQQRQESERMQSITQLIQKMTPKIHSDFIRALMFSDVDEEKFSMFADAMGFRDQCGYIFVLETNQKMKETKEMIEIELSRLSGGVAELMTDMKIVCYVPAQINSYRKKIVDSSKNLCEILLSSMIEADKQSVTIGIGNPKQSFQTMHESYREAMRALHYPNTNLKVRHFDDMVLKSNGEQQVVRSVVKSVLEGDDKNAADEILRDMDLSQGMEYARSYCQMVLKEVAAKLNETNATKNEFHSEIPFVQDAAELRQAIWDQCTRLCLQKKQNDAGQNANIQKAKRYILENLSQEISLEDVAYYVGLSPFYLSRQFKEHTGDNFVAFVNHQKIEKAMELAIKYNDSIRNLSKKVGFQNPTYFCKVFKKITGQTINEFRKKH